VGRCLACEAEGVATNSGPSGRPNTWLRPLTPLLIQAALLFSLLQLDLDDIARVGVGHDLV